MGAMTSVQTYRLALKKDRKVSLASAKISGPAHARHVAYALLHDAPVEQALAIGLDGDLAILGVIMIATIGSTRSVMLDPSIAAKAALSMNATAIIIAHNHPSGDPQPSAEDRKFTERLVEAGKLIGIPLVDHVIVTRDADKFYSFNAAGDIS